MGAAAWSASPRTGVTDPGAVGPAMLGGKGRGASGLCAAAQADNASTANPPPIGIRFMILGLRALRDATFQGTQA